MASPLSPGVTGPRTSILIVCEANVCRSPLVAFAAGISWAVVTASAGMNADDGAHLCSHVQERLVAMGEPGRKYAAAFRSRPVKWLVLGEYDLLLSATADLRTELVRRQPAIRDRAFTVLEALALSRSPLARSERNEFRNHGPAPVLLARRGTVAPYSVRVGGKRWASWDIPDGHNERRNRHHLATIDLAAKAGTELGLRLTDWHAEAAAGTGLER